MLKILSLFKTSKIIYMLATLAIIGGAYWTKSHIEKLNGIIKEQEQTIVNKEALLIISKAQNQISKANLSECNAKIDLQNEKIKSVSLDNKTLKKQIMQAKSTAQARYENLKPHDTGASCEEKLNLALGVIRGLGKKE
ncbi:hypothetical protein [Campylobacter sp. RM16187]|uniref:hypothetical protein n=1 Tax=Campylobacter sp. RM16187 TaxID=1660063 RepID=UPI0021B5E616|nr:hypothetical protein [Campylobacter sp. RM16187]QKG29721.1 hypothetical protein CDOMF_1483 [Campylobacter sp. RM16187]